LSLVAAPLGQNIEGLLLIGLTISRAAKSWYVHAS
jgi:hypothetical protein